MIIKAFYRISFWAALSSLPVIFFYNFQLFNLLNCDKAGSKIDWFFLLLTSLADGLWMMMIATVVQSLSPRNFAVFIIALILGSVLLQAGKFFFAADRPLRLLGEAQVCVLGQRLTLRSFPSGHSFSAILLFMYLRPARLLIALPVLIICSLAVVSRAYVGAHFPRDMITGALIAVVSYLVSELIVTRLRLWSWSDKWRKLSLGFFGLATALLYIFAYHEKTAELEFLLTPVAWLIVCYWLGFLAFKFYRLRKPALT